MKKFVVILIITSAIACNNNSRKINNNDSISSIITPINNNDSDSSNNKKCYCKKKIENNYLVNFFLQKQDIFKDTNDIKAIFLKKYVLKIEIKKGYEEYMYSIYTYSFDKKNKIVFYKSEEGFSIYYAFIDNPSIKLNKKIYFGMNKDSFSKALKINQFSCDTLQIIDDMGGVENNYIFKGDTLFAISAYSTI
jgi:hypothetical protein